MIHIKFVHQDDVYALEPMYGLVPDGEPSYPLVCPKCNDTLFVPVELPEEATISQPLGEMFRPNFKNPNLVIRGEPSLPSIAIYKAIGYNEQHRLKNFIGMAFVNEHGFELMIKAWSHVPVKHDC
jgi:hypothetical protein